MVFNGHTESSVNEISEEVFTEIQVMYADGMLGSKAIYDAIAPLTTAVFNYMRAEGQPAFRQDRLFPWIEEYWRNPDHDPEPQQAVSDGLKTYIMYAKGFAKERFKS